LSKPSRRCTLLLTSLLLAACDARPALVINEFMADNATTLANGETGEHNDWIELHNIGDEQITLEGVFMTDDLDRPNMHQLSPSLSIPPGGFLLLCASQSSVNLYQLDFALSAEGEELGLYWRDPATNNLVMLDGLSFPAQSTDVSMARDGDGTGAWTFCENPTPNASNR
jgi:hypothetical protein